MIALLDGTLGNPLGGSPRRKCCTIEPLPSRVGKCIGPFSERANYRVRQRLSPTQNMKLPTTKSPLIKTYTPSRIQKRTTRKTCPEKHFGVGPSAPQ